MTLHRPKEAVRKPPPAAAARAVRSAETRARAAASCRAGEERDPEPVGHTGAPAFTGADLVAAREAAQRTFAHELHDGIGQALTGLKLMIEIAAQQAVGAAGDTLRDANALVDDVQGRVRNLCLDLRPPALDHQGLLPALHLHCGRYTARTRIRVTLHHTGIDTRRFAPVLETAAFRVVQEALTNVARHAGVQEAEVTLWSTAERLGVQVADNGSGFDPRVTLTAPNSLGLVGIQERVRVLGGAFTVDSAPGAGARVTAEWPLRFWGRAGRA
jgi:signal transduction histidine kinase